MRGITIIGSGNLARMGEGDAVFFDGPDLGKSGWWVTCNKLYHVELHTGDTTTGPNIGVVQANSLGSRPARKGLSHKTKYSSFK
jgi:hypothetical protein